MANAEIVEQVRLICYIWNSGPVDNNPDSDDSIVSGEYWMINWLIWWDSSTGCLVYKINVAAISKIRLRKVTFHNMVEKIVAHAEITPPGIVEKIVAHVVLW